jgi:uncharacterized protein (TIGR02996 family)
MLAGVIADHWSESFLLAYADWLEDKGDPRAAPTRYRIAAGF